MNFFSLLRSPRWVTYLFLITLVGFYSLETIKALSLDAHLIVQAAVISRGVATGATTLMPEAPSDEELKKSFVAVDLARLLSSLTLFCHKNVDFYTLCWAMHDLLALKKDFSDTQYRKLKYDKFQKSNKKFLRLAYLLEAAVALCALEKESTNKLDTKRASFLRGMLSLIRLWEKYLLYGSDEHKKIYLCALVAHTLWIFSALKVVSDDLPPQRPGDNSGIVNDLFYTGEAVGSRLKQLIPDVTNCASELLHSLRGTTPLQEALEMPRQRIARFAGAQPIVSYDPDHGFSVTRQDAEGNQETTQLSTLLMEPGEPFILPACNHILSGRTSEERLRACPVCFYPRNNLYNIESTISFLDQENGELSYPQSNWWGRLPERIEGESSIAMQPYTRDTVEALALERGEVRPIDLSIVL